MSRVFFLMDKVMRKFGAANVELGLCYSARNGLSTD